MKIEIQHKDGSIEVAVSPVTIQDGDILLFDGEQVNPNDFGIENNQIIFLYEGEEFIINNAELLEIPSEELPDINDEKSILSGLIEDMDEDIEDIETEAGEDEGPQSSGSAAVFVDRNGASTNVEATLRDTSFTAREELNEVDDDIIDYADQRKNDPVSNNDYRDDLDTVDNTNGGADAESDTNENGTQDVAETQEEKEPETDETTNSTDDEGEQESEEDESIPSDEERENDTEEETDESEDNSTPETDEEDEESLDDNSNDDSDTSDDDSSDDTSDDDTGSDESEDDEETDDDIEDEAEEEDSEPNPNSLTNNGFGNGDDEAPGNSLDNNNAENSTKDKAPLLVVTDTNDIEFTHSDLLDEVHNSNDNIMEIGTIKSNVGEVQENNGVYTIDIPEDFKGEIVLSYDTTNGQVVLNQNSYIGVDTDPTTNETVLTYSEESNQDVANETQEPNENSLTNNGFGNGDQEAPGNSLDNNNAENAQDDEIELNLGNLENIQPQQSEVLPMDMEGILVGSEDDNLGEILDSISKETGKPEKEEKEDNPNKPQKETEPEVYDTSFTPNIEDLMPLDNIIYDM